MWQSGPRLKERHSTRSFVPRAKLMNHVTQNCFSDMPGFARHSSTWANRRIRSRASFSGCAHALLKHPTCGPRALDCCLFGAVRCEAENLQEFVSLPASAATDSRQTRVDYHR